MTAPKYTVLQFSHRNPHAKDDLMLSMIAVPNTPPEQIVENVIANTALPHKWLIFQPVTNRPAIMVGGGPSAADHIDDIIALKEAGGTIFATNAASKWLRDFGISTDYQVIADAKPESASLVDPEAYEHLFASVVNPATMNSVPNPIVWHPVIDGIAECFPEHRKTAEYSLIGGTTGGTYAMCAAYVLGFRELHCFGYDSSHRGEASHAYKQPMNDDIPVCKVEWGGKTYMASIAMKAQAEQFQATGRALQREGVTIKMYGDGLLPAMWNTPATNLAERDKYRLMWTFDTYRAVSPGAKLVDTFLEVVKPDKAERIIDFGCGTGRASVELTNRGYTMLLVDFADNCRDHEAIALNFLEWDLTKPIPQSAKYGMCCDVMEHIPPADVETVIKNIMASAPNVFFQISTVNDICGELIGTPLHLTVKTHEWWVSLFETLGFKIAWEHKTTIASLLLIKTELPTPS